MISKDTEWNLRLKPLARLLILLQKAPIRLWLCITTVLCGVSEVVHGGKWYYCATSLHSVFHLMAQLVAFRSLDSPNIPMWDVSHPTSKKYIPDKAGKEMLSAASIGKTTDFEEKWKWLFSTESTFCFGLHDNSSTGPPQSRLCQLENFHTLI